MDIIRETWITEKRSDESVISHVLTIRENLETMADIVKTNLENAQESQKKWYDKNARERVFQEGEQVLVLLPTSSNKLLAQWQGPNKVTRKVSKVNYQIDMHDRRKRKRIFHINMLRKWHEDCSTAMYAEVDDPEFEELTSGWKESAESHHEFMLGEKLNMDQRERIKQV